MSEFVASSNLTKFLSAIFLFCVLIASLIIAVYDSLNNIPINAYVNTVLYAGLGASINILGVHLGATTVQKSATLLEATRDIPASAKGQNV